MLYKYAKLEEDTRILLNQARAKLLREKPETKKYSDDKVIRLALFKYLNGG